MEKISREKIRKNQGKKSDKNQKKIRRKSIPKNHGEKIMEKNLEKFVEKNHEKTRKIPKNAFFANFPKINFLDKIVIFFAVCQSRILAWIHICTCTSIRAQTLG